MKTGPGHRVTERSNCVDSQESTRLIKKKVAHTKAHTKNTLFQLLLITVINLN